ncbi:MAG: imidazole glycerol phosphate synthase subunit HisH [Nocardioidaceae bacterium]|nr:imidazole glycerol phosphate synthase subunit HisH [Nocardioidaceae bacterium]
MGRPSVVVLDTGSGNIHSVLRAMDRAGAEATLSADYSTAIAADGLVVPGVGAYATCMAGLRKVQGDRALGVRLAGSRPVLAVCVGMQVMFDVGEEHGVRTPGCGQWPGNVERLQSPVVPHMGWNTVDAPASSRMFANLVGERFYFVHSYAARSWQLTTTPPFPAPLVSWTQYGQERFVSAVENGPLWATQFHPEKSGDAGAQLLRNWVAGLC